MKLTLETKHNKTEVTVPDDAMIEELFDAFKTCVIGATYTMQTFEYKILELADEINKQNEAK